MPLWFIVLLLAGSSLLHGQQATPHFRPQFHFSAQKNWLNDPNGLVYYDGEYHLFFQYNPEGDQWGNMSWGHAVTKDFINWEELPVAIPVSGNLMAFSGSAVVDWNNSSGFGDGNTPPMVAIYTATDGIQRQHIAYSLDKGRNWQNYAGNPVLNLFDDDFRDPKVIWHEPSKKWIMVVALANRHRIRFYASTNLRSWQFLQDFGPAGDVSGAWECPDFFPLVVTNQPTKTKWILQISVGPGKTRYFTGNFDGNHFTADKYPEETIDQLPDGQLIDDFEAESHTGWIAAGTAFGQGPTAGNLPGQLPVSGFFGTKLANSFNTGDQAKGTLTSYPFTINHKYINFKLAGGNDPQLTYIKLIVNGQTVKRETASRDGYLQWKSWLVESMIGQEAQIALIDSSSGSWGHILADQVFQSDTSMVYQSAPAGYVLADFEGDDYEGWTASGTAFGERPAQGTWPGQQAVTGFLGNGLINTFISGDEPVGKLISPSFVVDSNTISLLVGGGDQPDKCFVRLIISGNVVEKATGRNEERLRWINWDVSTFAGQEARIEIVDSASSGWGHINVDHIILTNHPPVDHPAVIDPVDYGMDFYATQSYHDIPEADGRRIWLAWMSNWSYASQVPTNPWRGIMSIPREVGLLETEQGFILTQKPVSNLQALREPVLLLQQLPADQINPKIDTLRLSAFELKMTLTPQDANFMGIKFRKGQNEETTLRYDVNEQKLIFDRSQSGILSDNESFSAIQEAPLLMKDGKINLHIMVDRCSVEVFANDGQLVISNLIFPDSTSNGFEFITHENKGFVDQLELWRMKQVNPNAVEDRSQYDSSTEVFPNPVNYEDVSINFRPSTGNGHRIDLYHITGKLLATYQIAESQNNLQISNNTFKTNGTYLLLIRSDHYNMMKKIQVIR